jgi:N-acetylglucosamine malate deacetylase 1
MLHTERILILAPHTDDGELGCGASIAKYTAAGKQVTYIAFSACRQSLPEGLPADTLAKECSAATIALDIQEPIIFDFEVRRFHFHRQQILDELIQLNKKFHPQTVFLPGQNDVHQDHQVIYAEGLRAFKECNILGYELPWNNTRFSPTYFERIAPAHLQAKQNALNEYRSQSHRPYMKESFASALAAVRGVQCGTALAEAFEVYRMSS